MNTQLPKFAPTLMRQQHIDQDISRPRLEHEKYFFTFATSIYKDGKQLQTPFVKVIDYTDNCKPVLVLHSAKIYPHAFKVVSYLGNTATVTENYYVINLATGNILNDFEYDPNQNTFTVKELFRNPDCCIKCNRPNSKCNNNELCVEILYPTTGDLQKNLYSETILRCIDEYNYENTKTIPNLFSNVISTCTPIDFYAPKDERAVSDFQFWLHSI
jgi:hypothetical protein